jgi:hypothetical protein
MYEIMLPQFSFCATLIHIMSFSEGFSAEFLCAR